MDNLDPKTNLAEILSLYPQTLNILRKFGIMTSG
jgi:hypothetical protein